MYHICLLEQPCHGNFKTRRRRLLYQKHQLLQASRASQRLIRGLHRAAKHRLRRSVSTYNAQPEKPTVFHDNRSPVDAVEVTCKTCNKCSKCFLYNGKSVCQKCMLRPGFGLRIKSLKRFLCVRPTSTPGKLTCTIPEPLRMIGTTLMRRTLLFYVLICLC
jgi:hypothetical protein